MTRRTDKILLIITALFVGALAIVAGAISFDHMRELATRHGQLGWKSYAFPISVDGLEIVASLYLVAQRRAGRPTGWVSWAALLIGTAASLSANIAVGGADPTGKALAGWPALSMLAAVKLLFSMLDHGADVQRTARDDQRTSGAVLSPRGTVLDRGRGRSTSASVVPDRRTEDSLPSPTESTDRPTTGSRHPSEAPGMATANHQGAVRLAPADGMEDRIVAHLIPAAQAARMALAKADRPLSRDNLAEAMRDAGHGVSNARASMLLRILKAEQDVAAAGQGFAPVRSIGSGARPGSAT